MTSNNKTIIFITLGIVSLAVVIVYSISAFFNDNLDRKSEIEKKSLNIEISGKIRSLKYTDKGIPQVEIKGDSFYILAAHTSHYFQLQKMDSLVKPEGKNIIYHYRNSKFVNTYEGPVIRK